MSLKSLSVIVPCHNEQATLEILIDRVLAADRCGLDLQIIIVDDASNDGSVKIAEALAQKHDAILLVRHAVNQGKGASLRTGFETAMGDIVLVQDADLEYNPDEYSKLLNPILGGRADVVYGSRFIGGEFHRVLYFWHSVGNKFLTLLSNMFTNLNLTDMETCYKVFRSEIIAKFIICENRFGFEPEITAKIAHMKPAPRIYEVGISYAGRTYNEGKKIGWIDGFRAIYCILRFNIFRDK